MTLLNPDPNPSSLLLVRRTVLAALLLGIGLIFVLTGRQPGWQPFALVSFVAVFGMLISFLSKRSSGWPVLFALILLLLSMFWKPDQPWAAVAGVILVLLNALKNANKQDDQNGDSLNI